MRLKDVEAILRALNEANTRYLIVDGLAVVAHGYPRLTIDVDIVLSLERENVLRAMTALGQIGYVPIVPVSGEQFADEAQRKMWREEKHMIVFQMHHPEPRSTRLDLFINEPFNFEEEYSKAEWLEVAGLAAPVVRIEALIQMKQAAGRPRDLGDVGELQKLYDIQKSEQSDH